MAFEGGMTNGMPIIVNGVMKPILLYINHLIPLILILKKTLKPRLNVLTAVPAASVVCEHVVAFEVAKAITEEFQSNHIDQLKAQIDERRRLNIEF